jgi:hypothetical protein
MVELHDRLLEEAFTRQAAAFEDACLNPVA